MCRRNKKKKIYNARNKKEEAIKRFKEWKGKWEKEASGNEMFREGLRGVFIFL